MPWIPYQELSIDFACSRDELQRRLEAAVEPKRVRFLSKAQRPFEGVVKPDGFRIERTTWGRKQNRPVIVGKVEPGPSGSSLAIVIRLSRAAAINAVVMVAVLLFVAPVLIWQQRPHAFNAALFVPFAILVVSYLTTVAGFSFEARKARRLLEGLAPRPAMP